MEVLLVLEIKIKGDLEVPQALEVALDLEIALEIVLEVKGDLEWPTPLRSSPHP